MECIKRRLLDAAITTYFAGSTHPAGIVEPEWLAKRREDLALSGQPKIIEHGFDLAIVGQIDLGIVIAFRGTQPPVVLNSPTLVSVTRDWLNDGQILLHDLGAGKQVHSGFWGALDRLWLEILQEADRLIQAGAPAKFYITGHSKGGPMANLAAWRLVRQHDTPASDVRVVTFAAARPGNQAFADDFAAAGIKSLGYEVLADEVPRLPPGTTVSPVAKWLSEELGWAEIGKPLYYVSVGTRIVDSTSILPAVAAQVQSWGTALASLFGKPKDFQPPLPLLIAAHSIFPSSAYDKLVHFGEKPKCTDEL